MASEVETLVEKKQEDVPNVGEEVEMKDKEESQKEDGEESDGDESAGHSKRAKKGDGSSKKVKADSSPKEPVTPVDRPTRERKTVERFTDSMQRLSSPKPFSIEKGSGTQLKDIPNVAFKLSKRKADETLQSLHTVLFNKRAKVNTLKKNVGMFSGFVWADDEEKQRLKVKEKLDKFTKEKLLEFCDILNLQIHKSASKKEEVSSKLLEFLQSPQATTEVLLAEKEQKAKKRKAKARKSRTPSTKKSGEKRKRPSKVKEENNVEDEDEASDNEDESKDEDEGNTPSKPESDEEKDKSEEDVDEEDKPEIDEEKDKSEEGGDDEEDKPEIDEDKDNSEEQLEDEKSHPKKSVKKDSGTKTAAKSKAVKKDDFESPAKSNKKSKKVVDESAGTPGSSAKSKASSSKKSKEEKNSKKTETKTSAKKDSAKDQGKGKTNKKAKAEPTNEEMHAVVASILKEVDFNTATLSDIIKQLGTHFGLDLLHRKGEVKAIITDVINSMSGDEDEEEEKEEKEAEGGSDKDGDGDNIDS